MPKPRTDRFCIRIDICVNNEINEDIEMHKAQERLRGKRLLKAEAAEKYFELLHQFYKQNSNKS